MTLVGTLLPQDLVRGIARLEPLPVTAQRLIAMVNGEDVSLVKLAELIEFDQAIAATVLKTSRSARFCRLFDSADGPRCRGPAGHDAAARAGARRLSQEAEGNRACLRPGGARSVAAWRRGTARRPIAEGRMSRRAHPGAFPEEITSAILHHHDAAPAQPAPVLDAVIMANLVAKTIETGLGAEGLNFTIDPAVHTRLGMTFDMFGRTCLETLQWLRELAENHGVPL
ncbi:MAG: HDOD domain-containing protein [Vicinamibacterales bacterium]